MVSFSIKLIYNWIIFIIWLCFYKQFFKKISIFFGQI